MSDGKDVHLWCSTIAQGIEIKKIGRTFDASQCRYIGATETLGEVFDNAQKHVRTLLEAQSKAKQQQETPTIQESESESESSSDDDEEENQPQNTDVIVEKPVEKSDDVGDKKDKGDNDVPVELELTEQEIDKHLLEFTSSTPENADVTKNNADDESDDDYKNVTFAAA